MTHRPDPPERHVIKRYAGARLYDSRTLRSVDMAQIQALLRAEADVVVIDAETGQEITEIVGTLH